jgi:DNA-binding NtrC family response regulator
MKPMRLNDLLLKVELKYMTRALIATNGCKAEAARILGLRRTTMVMRIRKLEDSGKWTCPPRSKP